MRIDDMAGLDRLARESESRRANGRPRMIFGLGTCGIAAGGLPLRDFARGYLLENGIGADVTSVGCIGMCHAEPLVDVKLPGRPRVTYGNVDEEKLRRIIGEHLVGGAPPVELAIGQLTSEMSECGHGMIDEPDAYDGIPTYGELPFFSKQRRIVLRNCGIVDPDDIAEYVARGGYRAAFTALHETSRGEIIEEMRQSGIRGRGGAGFSTGLKWELCARAPGDVKYLICNADEGDPGAYMDRAVLEGDPHSVIEGMVIAAYAMGATEGFIYIRAEYPLAIERLRTAIGQAEERGVLGEHVLGADLDFSISIRQGAGVFVCGEETALIRSIEGKRGEPRPRPPFPAASGLWGRPTNINNVETLANVAMIIQKGSSWFSSMGTPKSPGTKVFSLVGKIDRPGLIEVPMGIPMKDIIYDIGGGIPGGRRFKAVQTGGPSGGCIPAGNLDVPVDYENLQALGSIVGSGGMVVLDEDTCMVDIARYFLTFTSEESCGKCTPCRIGTRRMLEILERICNGKGELSDIPLLEELTDRIKTSALCALGGTAPNPVITTMRYFMDEYMDHIVERRCRASVCAALFRAPCQNTCPAGTNVPGYIQLLLEGRYSEAYEVNREENPFPSICGRVCEHPCEARCHRAQLDEAISIRELKRYCSDRALEGVGPKGPAITRLDPVGKSVAIVGGGPSGLSAAYFLIRMGYSATVYEASDELGGWLRYGIPEYRLPKRILDREIGDIVDLGVEVRPGCAVGKDVTLTSLAKDYDAVYIAVGAQRDRKLGLEGEELPGVLPGLELLTRINSGEDVDMGEDILVIGGGNVALDVARTAVRMGVKVTVCYRREERDMPAYDEEIECAKQEGVRFIFLASPKRLLTEGGRVVGAVFGVNTMGGYTKWGRRAPVPTDETIEVRADSVVVAVGQQLDAGFAEGTAPGLIDGANLITVLGRELNTDHRGIFAGGDAVLGPASVIDAIAHGKTAARSIDGYLGGGDRYARLVELNNTDYSMEEPDNDKVMARQAPTLLPVKERTRGFGEVVTCLDADCAAREASRCLRCDLGQGGDDR